MMMFLVVTGILAIAAIVWTMRDWGRDGYRRIPLCKGDDEWRGW
jgi:hypothetical protein